MMFSQVFAVRLRPEEAGCPVIWISGHTYIPIAETFEDFWCQYLSDPFSTLWP